MIKYTDDDLKRYSISLEDEDEVQVARAILFKSSRDRTLLELQYLERVFERYDIFKDMLASNDDETKLEVLRELRLEEAKKGNFVFHWGESGKLFYMAFRGSVFVMKRKELMRSGAKKSVRQTSIANKTPNLSPVLRQAERMGFVSNEFEMLLNPKAPLTESQVTKLYPEHTVLATLKTPCYFGEIALSQLTTRTASIFARETCYFAIMNRSTYLRVLADCQERKEKEKMEFLQMFPATSRLSETYLSTISTNFNTQTLQRNQVIFKEGDPAEFLYFVQRGEIVLNKEVMLTSDLEEAQNEYTQPIHKHNLLNETVSRRLTSKSKHQFNSKKNVRVAIVGKGEAIGDTDLAANPSVYRNTAAVYSIDATIYSISRNKLLNNCPDPQKVLKFLSEYGKRFWRIDVEEKLSRAAQNFYSTPQEAEPSKLINYIQKPSIDTSNQTEGNTMNSVNSNTRRSVIHRAVITESGDKNEDLWQLRYEQPMQEIPGIPKRWKFGISSPKNNISSTMEESKHSELGEGSPKSQKEKRIRTLKSSNDDFQNHAAAETQNPGHKKIRSEGNISPFTPLTISKLNHGKGKAKKEYKLPEKSKTHALTEGLKSPLSPRFSASIFVDKLFSQVRSEAMNSALESAGLGIKLKTSQARLNLESSQKGIYIESSPYLRSSFISPRAKNLTPMISKTTSMNEVGLQLTKHWETKYAPQLVQFDNLNANSLEHERDVTADTKSLISARFQNTEISLPSSPKNNMSHLTLKTIHAVQTSKAWTKQKKPLQMNELPEAKITKKFSLGMIVKADPFTLQSK